VGVQLFDAVLCDRDGTLIVDVPYNADPAKIRAMPGARAALDRLRDANLRIGVITNQSGLATGRFTGADLRRTHARMVELLGPFDTIQVCPHSPEDGCACRKPAPGLVYQAAEALGTVPDRCVVIGDIGRDVAAAGAAGAAGILVPTPVTRLEEVAAAPAVAGDLNQAVELILRRQRLVAGTPRRTGRILLARTDSAGDVLLTGPAVRAVAAHAGHVTLLCGPRGRAAAQLLPGVDDVVEFEAPWIDPEPARIDPAEVHEFVARLAALDLDEALIFTSFHQSPLPLALLLRLAGVARVGAISDDYPGSLLDLRHRVPPALPEPERALSLAAAAGFPLPPDDDGRLAVEHDRAIRDGTVVVHPGAAASARACPPARCRQIVQALADAGHEVVVTGGAGERELARFVAGTVARDRSGRTSLAGLATVLARAACLVAGNTGPAHLAAAVGTPVVSLFAPTVPFGQWGPYRVPWVRLGDAAAACRHSRATRCPVPGHPCLTDVDPAEVVAAVALLRDQR
jgi:histidinol-phosphate phosphatase family protein